MNEGFVPILEVPNSITKSGNRVVFESGIIMEYLEEAYPERGVKLWMRDLADKAWQQIVMKTFDDVASVMYAVIMSHGTLQSAVTKLEKAME